MPGPCLMLLPVEKLEKKQFKKPLKKPPPTSLDKMVLPPCSRCLSLCQRRVSCVITANSCCSGPQAEAAVQRCSAHSASVSTGLGLQRGRNRDGQASSCADSQGERLVKCEQEGLEQSRGEWPLNSMATYSGGGLQPHTLFCLCVLVSPGTCGGVFGGV